MTNLPPEFSKFDHDPEALAWARAKVQAYIDQLANWQEEANERGATAKGLAFGAARRLAQHRFLGDGGCTIGVFDQRMPDYANTIDNALQTGQEPT